MERNETPTARDQMLETVTEFKRLDELRKALAKEIMRLRPLVVLEMEVENGNN